MTKRKTLPRKRKAKAEQKSNEPRATLSPVPKPVRFTQSEEKQLAELASHTGLNFSELVRRAVRFAAPRFLSGAVSVLTLKERAA